MYKRQGYQTAAVHCFWAKYWSRDKAYPNHGFSDFISLEDMHGVTKVRKQDVYKRQGGDTSSSGSGTSSSSDSNKLTVWAWDQNFNIKAIETAAEQYKNCLLYTSRCV